MATVAKAAPQPMPRIAPREDLNPYRIAQIQFDLAAEYLKLDPGVRQILRAPKRVEFSSFNVHFHKVHAIDGMVACPVVQADYIDIGSA